MLLTGGRAFGVLVDRGAEHKAKYYVMLAQLNAGNYALDWTALRTEASLGGVGADFDENAAIAKMYASLDDVEYAAALQTALEINSHNMAIADAHYGAMLAYTAQGNDAKAAAEKEIALGLTRSIFGAGNGRSTDQAWTCAFAVDEEYVVRLLGLQIGGRHTYKGFEEVVAFDPTTNAESHYWFRSLAITSFDEVAETILANVKADQKSRLEAGLGPAEKELPYHRATTASKQFMHSAGIPAQ
jgi:hypothetical protein